jgi:hypothetical protein
VPIFYRTQPELAGAGTPYTPSLRDDSPGISAFLRVGDEVFHTYSAFRRGEQLALAASPPPRAAPDPRTMSSTLTASLSSQRFCLRDKWSRASASALETRAKAKAGLDPRAAMHLLVARTGADHGIVVDAREPRGPALDCVIATIGATSVKPKQKSVPTAAA